MPQRYSTQRSCAYFGVLVILLTVMFTIVRAREATAPLDELATISRLHATGQASAFTLANAEYHAAYVRHGYQARWTLAG